MSATLLNGIITAGLRKAMCIQTSSACTMLARITDASNSGRSIQEELSFWQGVVGKTRYSLPNNKVERVLENPMFWSSILAGAIISPSLIPKAFSNTLELKSRREFTEGEADAIKWLIQDSTKVGLELKIEQTPQECQLNSNYIWPEVGTLYSDLLSANTPRKWTVFLWLKQTTVSKDKIPIIILVNNISLALC